MNPPDGASSVCRPPASAPPDPPAGLATIQRVLLLGFGLIFVWWTIGVYEAFVQPQAATVDSYRGVQQRLFTLTTFGLLLTVIVAAAVLLKTRRVAKRIHHHQEQHGQNARDLQRLSARLVEALEQERRAVARELHDEVGQALTAIKMELSHAERARPGELPVGALEAARVATDSALHTVRDLTRLLHPRILDELGLVAAVETLVREFSRRTGVATELDHDDVEGRLDARVALCAYRIVQEALTNVGRHAAATHCRVSLNRLPDVICIGVEDNGRGFNPDLPGPGNGVGLLGIQERVAGCGGRYSLETGPGHGTCLTVELPVRPSLVEQAASGPPVPGASRTSAESV